MDLNLLKKAATNLEPINLPPSLDRGLLPDEKKILDLKYSGKPFGQMTLDEIQKAGKETLFVIHVITGWQVPANEALGVLIDQFNQKILEDYPNVTADEIAYAFRSNGHEVKEWGKALNISLIDDVMVPYLQKRLQISKVEEQKKLTEPPKSKEELDQIDMEFEAFKNSPLGKRLLPKS